MVAFRRDTSLALLLFQQAQCHTPQHSQVLASVAVLHAVVILREGYVQLPVQVVLDPPMIPQPLAVGAGAGFLAPDEATPLLAGRFPFGALPVTHPSRLQSGPLLPVADLVQVVEHDVGTVFVPPV